MRRWYLDEDRHYIQEDSENWGEDWRTRQPAKGILMAALVVVAVAAIAVVVLAVVAL